METADVVIVGAGLAGSSVAMHVSPHARVIALEQADQPGAEASAQNAGMIRRMGEDPFERALALRTSAFLADPGPAWADSPPSRICGALLALVRDPSHLNDAAAYLRARGVRVEACDHPGEIAPAFAGTRGLSDPAAFAPGSRVRSWYLPDERNADPHALVTGFVREARGNGAEFRFRTRVLRVRANPLSVETDRGTLSCGRVVLAPGAWAGGFARSLGLARERPFYPLARTLLFTEPHGVSRPDLPYAWLDDIGIYARPESGGWLISGCDEAIAPPAEGPGSKGPVDPLNRALAQAKLERWMPRLADVRFAGGWTGIRTFAPDRRPVLGADPDVPGLWWAAGLGGFGLTCCWGVGEALSAWMRGEDTPWLHAPSVSPGRAYLARFPIRPRGDLLDTRMVGPSEAC